MLATVLRWLLSLAIFEPYEQVSEQAKAIAAAAPDSQVDAATLAAISFAETRAGHGGVAFGACAHYCRHHCSECRPSNPGDAARWAITVLDTGRRVCGWMETFPGGARLHGAALDTVLGFYHSGRCIPDAFSRMEARLVAQMLSPSP